jgi:general nucleoside transport system permease protein
LPAARQEDTSVDRFKTIFLRAPADAVGSLNWREIAETFAITLAAILSSLLAFGVFIYACKGVWPGDLFYWMYKGGFGSKSSIYDTLTKAAPLILTALCTALPARVGLIIIGAEGALILGGLAAVGAGLALADSPVFVIQIGMALAGMLVGGVAIAAIGGLRHARGVNETISSLLFTYIAIGLFNYLVEGPMRDPASLNKPSTYAIPADAMMEKMFGYPVHWGLAFGLVFCVISYVIMYRSTFGFAAGMVGGNVRAAQAAGLPAGQIVLITCAMAGAAAGLAGMVEVAGVHSQANGSLIAGYGFIGILVSFIARHHPLAIPPVAILFGGLGASSGVLQRQLELNDASVKVLMGMLFVTILLFETLYRRWRIFLPREVREAMAR